MKNGDPRRRRPRLNVCSAARSAPLGPAAVGRTSKPFNPLLGETYELVMQEKGFRFLAEKVRGGSRPSG